MSKHLLVALVISLAPALAAADPTATVLVETDPSTFVLAGYAAHVRVAPPDSGWVVGAGLYGLTLPTPVVELDHRNRDMGWQLDLRTGYGLFADHHFAGAPRGWFVGGQLALQRWQLGQRASDAIAAYDTVLAMVRAGTLWHPFASGFFVMPWLGVGASVRVAGSTSIAGATYEPLPVLVFGAVHVGWALSI
jgi:hypothetical protein